METKAQAPFALQLLKKQNTYAGAQPDYNCIEIEII